MDQANNGNSSNSHNNNNNCGSATNQQQQQSRMLEQQIERYRAAAVAAQQQQQEHHHQQQQVLQQSNITHQQQQQQNDASNQAIAALDSKEEGLPQCKIKRNYSCSYCTYFTQNPRYHLTHLRDVHGEKIIIHKCKLCLYASRHFQKLVRHMKMVHGCTDGIPGTHGQPRGKRGMSREVRKRKLEQSVGLGVSSSSSSHRGSPLGQDMPTIEQVKRELQLQEQKLQVLAKQQEEQKQQQLANSAAEALFVAAYERQLQVQRERDLEALQAAALRAASFDREVGSGEQQSPPPASNTGFQLPPAHQQHKRSSSTPSRNIEQSPSPTGSTSPTNTNTTTYASPSAAHGDTMMDHSQNRLLKCSVCELTTLYREQLIDHELEEHCKTKFFRCEKCSYVTHIKARFSKHVKYHSMPMIKCVACDFRTPYKWNLDRHMKNHGGAGPFKCAACDFTADIKQSLTVHEMNHHVPPVGHAAGMSLARRRNKVGGTDLSDDFLSDSADMLEDHFNNNNLDDYDEVAALTIAEDKKCRYTDEEPTDLSQKGGSSDTSSVHNQSLTPKSKRPVPNLIPLSKSNASVLNLSKNLNASRSSLTDIASMFFNDKQLNEMLQPFDKADAAQLSPTTTIASGSSQNSRSLLQRRGAGSFFDKLKSSALVGAGPNGNLLCPCGHIAKCLSESIIHRKTCNMTALAVEDDLDEEPDDTDGGRLEIDLLDDDEKQSHSALNLSVTGSTRCQHCRHRCKSSADLLAHMKQCMEASRFGNESYDSTSGESSTGRGGGGGVITDQTNESEHPMENRVFVWNKPRSSDGANSSKPSDGSSACSNNNDENSYYGVETAPGYGEMAYVVGVPRRDPCQKYQLPVFLAERLTVGKKVFHRTCLKCARCGSQLTVGSFYETEVDDVFCCETYPNEEEFEDKLDNEASGISTVNLRSNHDKEKDTIPLKPVRSSVADRLVFFEKTQSADNSQTKTNKLIGRSLSDEEKSKEFQKTIESTTKYKKKYGSK